MFDGTERVRTGLNQLDSDNVNSPTSRPVHSECLQRVLPVFSSEIDEKLIELVRKCEEIYYMSNKNYSDSVWKEKLWGQTGEELKKSGKFQLRILKLLSFCYHRSSNN
jgi:hypothetical protein